MRQTEATPPAVSGSADRIWSARPILTLTIAFCIAIVCASSIGVSKLYANYYVDYQAHALTSAALAVAAFAPVFLLFVLAEFSFGYLVGFYLSIMVAGYLWLTFFSLRTYDHKAAGISAAVSAFVFLLPALFVSSPLRQIKRLSVKSFDRLLLAVFLACLAIVVIGATYNFKLVSPGDASNQRFDAYPSILNYLIGISLTSLLPFLFAHRVAQGVFWQAGAVALLMLCYYPVAITKTAFFAPVWLIMMSVLCRILGARMAVVLSLLLPTSAGVALFLLIDGSGALSRFASAYFFNVNFRMLGVPSLALDLYNEFFTTHELTHFCQIGVLKWIMGCPYQDQLAVVMLNYFPGGGTYNASLLATEGIASVGWLYAPVTAFLCGLVIALGNRASAGLPPSLVLVSGAVLGQILLNVPLSTALVTHGAALLFLLWYVTPRDAFGQSTA